MLSLFLTLEISTVSDKTYFYNKLEAWYTKFLHLGGAGAGEGGVGGGRPLAQPAPLAVWEPSVDVQHRGALLSRCRAHGWQMQRWWWEALPAPRQL